MKVTTEHTNCIKPCSEWNGILEEAVREVFQLMLATELEAAPETPAPRNVTAMVGLAGVLCGVLSVSCDSETASQMAAAMLGIPEEEASDSLRDAIGEICNMVAGNFKAKIDGLADACMLSVPTVICGEDYALYPLTDGETMEASLGFNGASLSVRLDIHN